MYLNWSARRADHFTSEQNGRPSRAAAEGRHEARHNIGDIGITPREDVRNLILGYPIVYEKKISIIFAKFYRVNPEILGYPGQDTPDTPLASSLGT